MSKGKKLFWKTVAVAATVMIVFILLVLCTNVAKTYTGLFAGVYMILEVGIFAIGIRRGFKKGWIGWRH